MIVASVRQTDFVVTLDIGTVALLWKLACSDYRYKTSLAGWARWAMAYPTSSVMNHSLLCMHVH